MEMSSACPHLILALLGLFDAASLVISVGTSGTTSSRLGLNLTAAVPEIDGEPFGFATSADMDDQPIYDVQKPAIRFSQLGGTLDASVDDSIKDEQATSMRTVDATSNVLYDPSGPASKIKRVVFDIPRIGELKIDEIKEATSGYLSSIKTNMLKTKRKMDEMVEQVQWVKHLTSKPAKLEASNLTFDIAKDSPRLRAIRDDTSFGYTQAGDEHTNTTAQVKQNEYKVHDYHMSDLKNRTLPSLILNMAKKRKIFLEDDIAKVKKKFTQISDEVEVLSSIVKDASHYQKPKKVSPPAFRQLSPRSPAKTVSLIKVANPANSSDIGHTVAVVDQLEMLINQASRF